MPRKAGRNTKGRIVSAAWKLFYEQGYDNTTVEDIIFESQTSKGSFYHYFEGKDALLGSLSMIFDEKYEELKTQMDPDMPAMDALIYLNRELFLLFQKHDIGIPFPQVTLSYLNDPDKDGDAEKDGKGKEAK